MKIVRNTMLDMVPKAITLFIIKELEGFIRNDLTFAILPQSDEDLVRLFAK